MKITIKSKNLEITPSITALIQKGMNGIKNMINAVQESAVLFIEVEKDNGHHRKGDIFLAEVMVELPSKKLIAQSRGESLQSAITEVKAELKRELSKYKTKTVEYPRRKAMKSKNDTMV